MIFSRIYANALLIFGLGVTCTVQAGSASVEMTAAGLLRDCQEFLSVNDKNYKPSLIGARNSGRCLGNLDFVITALEFLDTNPDKPLVCLPKTFTNGELARITVKYIEDNPTVMHKPRSHVMATAIGIAYKCKG
jgi:hypothetical protein